MTLDDTDEWSKYSHVDFLTFKFQIVIWQQNYKDCEDLVYVGTQKNLA
jgi:hypothetical protein